MDAWFHCENPYPFVPDQVLDVADSVRASLPNRYCDPKVAAQLFEETLDEYLLCDEFGLNITSSEHHAGINCLYGANPLVLGIVARQTKKIRLLSMGTLVTVRQDPVRVAEEYATADVISRGRLEIGFVKSGGTEMASGNANPIGVRERFWEAIDLIGKTLTTHDGPFSLGGQALYPPSRQHLAAALSGPASADVGGDFGPGRHRRDRPARHGQHHGHARGRGHQARLGLVSPSAGRGRVVKAGDRPLWLFGLCLCRGQR